MIYLGLDDTDMPDTPGTNKLAMHLAQVLDAGYETQWIVRHQMLVDPRVPCTRMNGSVSMALVARHQENLDELIAKVRDVVLDWVPAGSDPGLCVATGVPSEVQRWGRRGQTELLEMADALRLAHATDIYLEPLGGTGGGVIGALAAVGLLATWNSGRVVHRGRYDLQPFDVTGVLDTADVLARGIQRIERLDTTEPVERGTIELGKRLRPNLREGQVVLYVLPSEPGQYADWQAQRVVA